MAQSSSAPSSDPWKRVRYTAPSGSPFIFYVVFGADLSKLAVSREAHNVDGKPAELDIVVYSKSAGDEQRNYIEGFYADYLGAVLKSKSPALHKKVIACNDVAVIRGEFEDSDSLSYLKNSIGITQAVLETGAAAILDLQTIQWFDPAEWTKKFFDPKSPVPHEHVWIYTSKDGNGAWLHTRGMRTFGRPDISIRNVSEPAYERGIEIINRFIEAYAYGLAVDAAKEIRIEGMGKAASSSYDGDFENFDFNNRHIEIEGI